MRLINSENGIEISSSIRVADRFFLRLKGLLGTDSLPHGNALLIRPCNSVHTFGMRYSIDVLFVDKNNRIIKMVPNMRKNRVSTALKANYVIELPAGTISMAEIRQGSLLLFHDKNSERGI